MQKLTAVQLAAKINSLKRQAEAMQTMFAARNFNEIRISVICNDVNKNLYVHAGNLQEAKETDAIFRHFLNDYGAYLSAQVIKHEDQLRVKMEAIS